MGLPAEAPGGAGRRNPCGFAAMRRESLGVGGNLFTSGSIFICLDNMGQYVVRHPSEADIQITHINNCTRGPPRRVRVRTLLPHASPGGALHRGRWHTEMQH